MIKCINVKIINYLESILFRNPNILEIWEKVSFIMKVVTRYQLKLENSYYFLFYFLVSTFVSYRCHVSWTVGGWCCWVVRWSGWSETLVSKYIYYCDVHLTTRSSHILSGTDLGHVRNWDHAVRISRFLHCPSSFPQIKGLIVPSGFIYLAGEKKCTSL